MAAAKKGSRSSSSRSSSGSSRSNSGSGRSRKGRAPASISGGFWSGLIEAVLLTFFGRALLVLLAAALLIAINLLFSRDRFEVFYILCAIEIIAFVAIGWLRVMLHPDDE